MGALRRVLATWFGSGYFPVAPGTAGTAASVPLVLLLLAADSRGLYLAVTGLVIVVGLWSASHAVEDFGSHDPGTIVIDETAGFLVACFALPEGPAWLAAAFVFFRVADVFKPWPARRLEQLPGSWGIMADDLAAGAWAALACRLLARIGEGLA